MSDVLLLLLVRFFFFFGAVRACGAIRWEGNAAPALFSKPMMCELTCLELVGCFLELRQEQVRSCIINDRMIFCVVARFSFLRGGGGGYRYKAVDGGYMQ